MGKTLVLAEKPSVARDLAKVLHSNQRGEGCLMGNQYIVTWALGHLVTLAEPEVYGDRYKSWKLEDLPMLPNPMKLTVIKETAKQFRIVKGLLKRADVDELVIATDAGREGELVARWILQEAGFRKPIKRLWISSQTDKAIKEGFTNLKNGRQYEALYHSAQCRAEADWLVGLNVTRALTCKYNAQLSAGRVQTPTLALIVEREKEIKRFVPKDYWSIQALADGFTLAWQEKKTGQRRVFDKGLAEGIVNKIEGSKGTVVNVVKELGRELPPLAYDLTELQRDANKRHGFPAKKTLNIMQSLYESHKLATYPRTDSRYITEDIVPTLTERLKSIAVGPYAKAAGILLTNRIHVSKRFVDNAKVSDHHAIIPTEQYVNLSALSSDERKVYDLIVKRFMAVLSTPFLFEQTSVQVDIRGQLFTAKGKVVKELGWKAMYQEDPEMNEEVEDKEPEQLLPSVLKGDILNLQKVRLTTGKTKPPARYTEASLLTAMEHPGKFIDDKNLREVMSTVSGLGTPATRADIIEKLFNSFYAERRGQEIIPTSKGNQLVDIVPEDLKSAELTAKWEQQLQYIAKGQIKADSFMKDMKAYAAKLVSTVIASDLTYRHDNLTREKCPDCGQYLLDVKGKKGKILVCPDRECGYRKGVSQVSNARCPECHKKMEIRGEGEDKRFACVCGFREKLTDYNKRRVEKVDKREVHKVLNLQDLDAPINSAMADALAKWKK